MSPEQFEEYGPDDDDGYDYPDAVDIAEEWQPGQCDNCSGPPATDAERRAVLASSIVPVCACWTGQGASPDACMCGPEQPEAERQRESAGATVPRRRPLGHGPNPC